MPMSYGGGGGSTSPQWTTATCAATTASVIATTQGPVRAIPLAVAACSDAPRHAESAPACASCAHRMGAQFPRSVPASLHSYACDTPHGR